MVVGGCCICSYCFVLVRVIRIILFCWLCNVGWRVLVWMLVLRWCWCSVCSSLVCCFVWLVVLSRVFLVYVMCW